MQEFKKQNKTLTQLLANSGLFVPSPKRNSIVLRLLLIKKYCGRMTDEVLKSIVEVLPQTISGDRSASCAILQADKEIDRWLSQASGAEDWFNKVDSIGELAVLELELRSKKK